jgi:hypothetical protein
MKRNSLRLFRLLALFAVAFCLPKISAWSARRLPAGSISGKAALPLSAMARDCAFDHSPKVNPTSLTKLGKLGGEP